MQFSLNSLLLLTVSIASTTEACLYKREANPPTWKYDGMLGPLRWHKISEDFAKCGNGTWQSPIAITDAEGTADNRIQKLGAGTVSPKWGKKNDFDFFNNGHGVQLELNSTQTPLTTQIRGCEEEILLQFHFHTPSEHWINGTQYPLELHFVHRGKETGKLSVVGVLFDIGRGVSTGEFFKQLAPKQSGRGICAIPEKDDHVKVEGLVLENIARSIEKNPLHHYRGSLTTPPCTEDVDWYVSEQPMRIEVDQFHAFRDVIKMNSRPAQNYPGSPNLMHA